MEHNQPTEKKMNAAAKLRGPEINFDSEDQRALIEEAAQSRGLSVTAFIRTSALKEANEILKQNQLILLSERDWTTVTELLDSPPAPTLALKKLLKA